MRNQGLDVLRGMAILLVLFRHAEVENLLVRFGWLGVDLFFVLSGFLVSGLLFAEYKRTGAIDSGRFLFRRAFKIFPPFYFFVVVTLVFDYYVTHASYSWSQVIAELLYVKNYTEGIWLHTWSLNVEEHFYLLLIVAMVFALKTDILMNRKAVLSFLIFLLVLSFAMRLRVSLPHEENFIFMRTHLRADGIILGVLLSYLYHFTTWTDRMLRHRSILFLIALFLVAPGFYFEGGSFFMNVYGLSLVNLGFTILVLLFLKLDVVLEQMHAKPLNGLVRGMAFIGIHSYSIYLWHLNAHRWVYSFVGFNDEMMATLYIGVSIGVGIVLSYTVERNALKVRDRLWQK